MNDPFDNLIIMRMLDEIVDTYLLTDTPLWRVSPWQIVPRSCHSLDDS